MTVKNCVVTGGAGFIGGHLVERLLSENHKVAVVDDFSSGLKGTLAGIQSANLTILEGSILDSDLVDRALRGVNYVFHLAAIPSVVRSVEEPWATHNVNITGTLQLLEKCRKISSLEKFVFTSSSAVYGDTPELPKKESMAGTILSPYALHKWTGEGYIRLYQSLYQVPGVSLRPFNIFGPRQRPDTQYAAVIPLFIRAALAHQPLLIDGDGGQTRDFIYVTNMVDAFVLAAKSTDATTLGQAYNVGAGGRVSILTLAKTIVQMTGSKSEIRHAPARVGDIRDSYADLSRISAELGYQPKVSFQSGLEALIAYYRK